MHQLMQLSKLVTEMKKWVQESNTNQQPSMPHKVVQQRKQSTYQAIGQLREAKKICTKAVETIATVWEKLIEDETADQLAKQAQKEEQQVVAVKAEIKKLQVKENISKGAELKQLQAQVRTIRE